MKFDLHSIIDNFQLNGTVKDIKSHGSGHINDTFKIKNKEKNLPDYLLQRVNHYVFKDVPGLMNNLDRILKHINSKLGISEKNWKEHQSLVLVPTTENKPFYLDNAGNFWRVFHFIDDAHSYDIIEIPDIAYEGGKAFGKYVALLNDLPGEPLIDTIPNFHNIKYRLSNFQKSVRKNAQNRIDSVKAEIDFVERRSDEMLYIYNLKEKGAIPVRNCHNDTKLNNVLFDQNNNALCVIDLDTTMQGLIHFDFGDSIRTAANTAEEDEKDLSKINFNLQLYKAYAQGFLESSIDIITDEEIKTLAFSGKLLTFIMGLRFLTDYIDGDIYYKTNHKEHNLQRAKAQFQLLKKMEEAYQQKQAIIKNIFTQLKNT